MHIILSLLTAYLLGSIPFAYIAGRLKKNVDIREVGGGNMGALNVMREVGTLTGYAVWLGDLSKGALAIIVARWLEVPEFWVLASGFCAVLGHNLPVFLRFRGGKGGAAIMGVLLMVVPVESLSGFLILFLVVVVTSNPALGLGIGLASLPLFVWLYGGSALLVGYTFFLFLFVSSRFILEGLKKAGKDPGLKKDLVFSRDYHFWQVKKSDDR